MTLLAEAPSIGCGAFAECPGLVDGAGFLVVGGVLYGYYGEAAEVTVPAGVKRIDGGVFQDNMNLVRVTIPEGVTSIGSRVFASCGNLASVTIPESATDIGGDIFAECAAFPYDEQGFQIVSGVLCAYRGEATSLSIPAGVTRIAAWTFAGHDEIEEVTIPPGVVGMGQGAFESCGNLYRIRVEFGDVDHVRELLLASGMDEGWLWRVYGGIDPRLFKTEEVEGGVEITGFDGEVPYDLEIPSRLNGLAVVGIADGAFSDSGWDVGYVWASDALARARSLPATGSDMCIYPRA